MRKKRRLSENFIDETDLELLELLRYNSRISYARLASELGISESAVRKRVNKLVKAGVIKKFTIEYELDNEVRAAILVKTTPPTPVPEVSSKLVRINGVDAVYEITGDNDILVLVRVRSIREVNECIDKIRSTPGVAATNSMIILKSWIR